MKEDKLEKRLKIASIFAMAFCCILLFPQIQNGIIGIIEKTLERNLDNHIWMNGILEYSLFVIFGFACFLIFLNEKCIKFSKKYWDNIFIFVSIAIVAMSVIVRIIMYIKCRSLWVDEAALAESIVSRNWLELLAMPLSNNQSAPVLYVVAIKVMVLDKNSFFHAIMIIIYIIFCKRGTFFFFLYIFFCFFPCFFAIFY